MILYKSNAIEFRRSVDDNTIVDKIEDTFKQKLGRRPADSERLAWNNSMQFMGNVVRNSRVSDDCGILIEYTIPSSSKRVDFIISGQNERDESNFVIVELKQWDAAEATDRADIVRTFVGGHTRDMAHPSYQAFSYKQMLDDMNTAIQRHGINSFSCAYLHNYTRKHPEPLALPRYKHIIADSPIYFRQDTQQLWDFIHRHVNRGKGMEILYQIENGKIKPSKKLMDFVASIFNGNQEYILLDEQKVAFETIMSISRQADKKRTIIVKGGPETGKSVVSLNAFSQLIQHGKNVLFVAPNAAFRTVLIERLMSDTPRGKGRIRNLFAGSSQFLAAPKDLYDALIIDEAHRLKGKGAYQYQGENQIEDIVSASKVNVFFVDDSQRIRPEDIGSVEEVKRVARKFHSDVYEIELQAQFRCAGAEGFINWLDTLFQIRDTGNYDGWDKEAFEFKIVDDPNHLRTAITEKNAAGYASRLLAGFAWKWTDEKHGNRNGEIDDVVIPEYHFSMPWNSRANRTLWAVRPEGLNQIGCIHTSQGLEFDYVGIIIGNDLRFDPKSMQLYASYDNYKDSIGKRGLKDNPEKLKQLITNVYKTLMSRGMKGCYVYCVDTALQEYFKEHLSMTEDQI